MQCKLKDETGNRYGSLIVIKRVYYEGVNKGAKWLCKCDCGNEIELFGGVLRNGSRRSCGCVSKINFEKMIKNKLEAHKTTFKFDDSVVTGTTHDGVDFIFDLDDYSKIKNYNWRIHPNGYVSGSEWDGIAKTILLHRLIMNVPKGYVVDHINHDKLDNRKSNLRICTYQENNRNKRKLNSNTSGVVGVTYNKKHKKWYSQIGLNDKTISLGGFDDFEDAVKTRKIAENELFGEFKYNES